MPKAKPTAHKLVRSRKGTTEIFKISLTGKKILSSLGSMYENPKQRSKTPSTPEKWR
jgi:hypothetical protein